jgi:hypothetical protein
LGDAEWLDQRAHRFADPFVRIGLLTGRQDLIARGVAAARSSLTLANHPRHQTNGIYRYTDFPVGLGPENIDHEGFPQRPLSSGPSWNSVGGLAGVAHVMDRLGGVYVDFDKNLAVGLDGVKVISFQRQGQTLRLKLENQLATLPVPYDEPYSIELRVVGLPPGQYTLYLNDRPPQQVDADALSHFSFLETPKPSATSNEAETPRVEIDVQQTGAEISPLLFGHNLEHTRQAIWQGIEQFGDHRRSGLQLGDRLSSPREHCAFDCGQMYQRPGNEPGPVRHRMKRRWSTKSS